MSEYYNLFFDVDNQDFQDNYQQLDADDEEINNNIQFNVYPQLFNYCTSAQDDDVDIQENREKIVAYKITIEDEQKKCEIPLNEEFDSNFLEDQDIISDEDNNRSEQDPVQSEYKNCDNKTTQEIQNAPIKKKVVLRQEQSVNICEMKKDVKIDKQKVSEQVETKNLPNYYCRTLLKYAKNKVATSQTNLQEKQQQNKKLLKFDKKINSCTLKTLRDMLNDAEISNWALEYFTSFQFLDDLLKSEKQQDVRPPIKYLNKMYLGCLDRNTLIQWKET